VLPGLILSRQWVSHHDSKLKSEVVMKQVYCGYGLVAGLVSRLTT
jgi:hypothetical protein